MKLRSEFIETRDIDYFFICSGHYIHVSTAGGDIPDWINDQEKIMDSYRQIYELPDIWSDKDIIVNREYLKYLLFSNIQDDSESTTLDNYLKWFVGMAKKGFMSFDRTDINHRASNSYHLVAYPRDLAVTPLKVSIVSNDFGPMVDFLKFQMFYHQIAIF